MRSLLAVPPFVLVAAAVAAVAVAAPVLGAAGGRAEGAAEDVRITQQGLRLKGYRPGPVDGICGPRTLDAMARYAESGEDIGGGGGLTCADARRYSYLFQREMGPRLPRSLGIAVVTPDDVAAAASGCDLRGVGVIEGDVGLARHTAIEHRRDALRLQVVRNTDEIRCWVEHLERGAADAAAG